MPDWKPAIRSRLAGLELHPTRAAEIIEELTQHLDDRYQESRSAGATEEESHALALAELEGDRLAALLEPIERRTQPNPPVFGAGRRPTGGGLGNDLRYAVRALRRNPAFTAVAILSLALGTGANAAVFRLLEAVRFRSLPVRAPEELVDIKITDRQGLTGQFGGIHPDFSFGFWERIRERQQGLAGVFAWTNDAFDLAEGGLARNAQGLWVSGEFFPTLGVPAALGRLFSPNDDRPGCPAAAVLSHAFWERELNGDSTALGRTLLLDGNRVPIQGVTPPSFFGVEVGRRFDVAVPLCAEPILRPNRRWSARMDAWWLAVSGRLAPGWTAERVTAHLRAISPGLFEELTPTSYSAETARVFRSYHLGAVAGGNGRSRLRTSYESSLWFLLAIGGLVLVIACANVANLLLARASTREREIAARLALGASRARLVRQLLVESLVLAVVGVGLGAVLSEALTRYLVTSLTTSGLPLYLELAPGLPLLGFTALVAGLTCLIFGLGPAIRSTSVAPAGAMRAAGRGLTTRRERHRAQRLLVVGQVALSMVLVVAALWYVRSFRNLMTTDPGFRLDGIVVASPDLSRLSGGEERRRVVSRELLERVRTVPGVAAAATTTHVPLDDWWNEFVEAVGPEGKPVRALANFSQVSDGYFATMEISLLAGRDFGIDDRRGGPQVAIVNEAFARRFFGGQSPVGRTLGVVSGPTETLDHYQIIGLVTNTKYTRLRDDFDPVVFVPASQGGAVGIPNILARGLEPSAFGPAMRELARGVDPDIGLELTVLQQRVRRSLSQDRIMATLSGYFGGLALLLATVGLYGLLAYLVARRTNEVGLRMALGADRSRIIRMIVRESLGMAVAGLLVGTVLTGAAIKLSKVVLFGLTPSDPVTFAIGIVTLGAAALLAGYLPARRAARIDPMAALRAE